MTKRARENLETVSSLVEAIVRPAKQRRQAVVLSEVFGGVSHRPEGLLLVMVCQGLRERAPSRNSVPCGRERR